MNYKITDTSHWLFILVLLICLTGCSRVSRLNAPEEDPSAPETEQAGQQEPEEQKPSESLVKKLILAPVRIPIAVLKIAIAIPKFIISLPFRPFMSKSEPEPEQPSPIVTETPIPQSPALKIEPASPEAVSISPSLVETELKQISYELNQISGELRQITQLLRVMSGVSQELIAEQMVQDTDRPELNERVRMETPTTIRPVFTSPDAGAATAKPDSALDVSDLRNVANTAQTALNEINAALERTNPETVETDSVEGDPALATAEFELALINVTRSESADAMFGTPTISREERGIFSYKDTLLTIVWNISPRDIAVTISNTSNDSLMVLWADAAYIDADSVRHAVIHDKITYQNTEKAQLPTELHPYDTISDVLYPADYIVFNNTVGWLQYPLVPFIAFDLKTGKSLTDGEFTARVNE